MDAADEARAELEQLISDQAGAVDLKADDISKLWLVVLETEGSLIPDGLHIVGRPMGDAARAEMLKLMNFADPVARAKADRLLAEDHELHGLMKALSGRFIAPVPGYLIRSPQIHAAVGGFGAVGVGQYQVGRGCRLRRLWR